MKTFVKHSQMQSVSQMKTFRFSKSSHEKQKSWQITVDDICI